ncbi:MAG: type II toxin-antitoxin system HicA family toxin [Chloroflexi bacterium]|nr:type II toxin-antitoxin system HicA family toxin [Chloroflexota bacterium]
MPKLPQVSGDQLVSLLKSLDYTFDRQKGSHVTYEKTFKAGKHTITVPLHKEITKGTLNDILNRIGLFNGLSKEDLVKKLKKL